MTMWNQLEPVPPDGMRPLEPLPPLDPDLVAH